MSLEQLKNFCEFEATFGAENKTHIAQWALAEIERLTAALETIATVTACAYSKNIAISTLKGTL
jgi:hypothetical protein